MQSTHRNRSRRNASSFYRERVGLAESRRSCSRSVSAENFRRAYQLDRHDEIKSRLLQRVVRAKPPSICIESHSLMEKLTSHETPKFRPCIRICPNLSTVNDNPFERRHQKTKLLHELKHSLFRLG